MLFWTWIDLIKFFLSNNYYLKHISRISQLLLWRAPWRHASHETVKCFSFVNPASHNSFQRAQHFSVLIENFLFFQWKLSRAFVIHQFASVSKSRHDEHRSRFEGASINAWRPQPWTTENDLPSVPCAHPHQSKLQSYTSDTFDGICGGSVRWSLWLLLLFTSVLWVVKFYPPNVFTNKWFISKQA